MKKTRRPLHIVGVMTGTSCDSLDAACLEIDSSGWAPVWEASVQYPRPLRDRVLTIQMPGAERGLETLLALDRDLGEWYGAALARILRAKRRPGDVIANHGQTVAHYPAPERMGVTLQLGDPA